MDLVEMDRRRRLVREKMEVRRKEEEEALLQGRVMAYDDSANTTNSSWKKDLNFSPDWYPVLIVVPPTTVQNWKNEFAKFSHFSVATFVADEREKALESLRNGSSEVLLTSRSLFMQQDGFRQLNKFPWKLIIIDEFHLFKVRTYANHDNMVCSFSRY
jgi:SNF2 family DNA or RNA helicase